MISTRHVPQTLPTPEDTMALGPRESVATARILIVDDNRHECETMQAILAGSGHTVKATDTGLKHYAGSRNSSTIC